MRRSRIDSIAPATLPPGTLANVVVKGRNSSSGCYLEVDGKKQTRSSVTGTERHTEVNTTGIADGATVKMVVVDPDSRGDISSDPFPFTLKAAG